MSSSRIPMLFRAMHTGGRRVPHAPMGGAGEKGPGGSKVPKPQEITSHLPPTPSPSSLPPIDPTESTLTTSTSEPTSNVEIDTPPKLSVSPEDVLPTSITQTRRKRADGGEWEIPNRHFKGSGKEIIFRPRRSIPVTLPNGFPEPRQYPPGQEYVDSIEGLTKTVRPHPLWQFFHLTKEAKEVPFEATEPKTLGAIEMKGKYDNSIRAWSTGELRYKSFAEIHALWYVMLKERNVLYTQDEERKRMAIPRNSQVRLGILRKSMARIKMVLQERRLGLQAAILPMLPDVPAPYPWSDPSDSHSALSQTSDLSPKAMKDSILVPKVYRDARRRIQLRKNREKKLLAKGGEDVKLLEGGSAVREGKEVEV